MLNDARKILTARMQTWTTTPIIWANRPPQSLDGQYRVSFYVLPEEQDSPTIGRDLLVQYGNVVVNLFAPIGVGDALLTEYAEQIAGLFRRFSAGGVFCKDPIVKTIGKTPDETAYQMSVVVPWETEADQA